MQRFKFLISEQRFIKIIAQKHLKAVFYQLLAQKPFPIILKSCKVQIKIFINSQNCVNFKYVYTVFPRESPKLSFHKYRLLQEKRP